MAQRTQVKPTPKDEKFYRELLMDTNVLPARHGQPVGSEYDDIRATVALTGAELRRRTKPLTDWAVRDRRATADIAEHILKLVEAKEGAQALELIAPWTQFLDPEKEAYNKALLARRIIELLAWGVWKMRNYIIPYEGIIEDTENAEQVVTNTSEAIWMCFAFLKNRPELKKEIIRHFLVNIWSQHIHYALYTKRLTDAQSQEGLRTFKSEVIDPTLDKFKDGVRLTAKPLGTPERVKLERDYLQYAFLGFYGRRSKNGEIGWERQEIIKLEEYLNEIFVRGRTKLRITDEMKADYRRLVDAEIITQF